MTKKSMKSALASSLKAEDDAVRIRFEKAESLFADKKAVVSEPDPGQQGAAAVPEKVIRDSFTLPASDYELISQIKQRCLKAAVNATKSEIVRAGLHALNAMTDEELLAIVESLEKVKTGRPATNKKR